MKNGAQHLDSCLQGTPAEAAAVGKPVCACGKDRATCPDCGKGWLQQLQSGTMPAMSGAGKA